MCPSNRSRARLRSDALNNTAIRNVCSTTRISSAHGYWAAIPLARHQAGTARLR